MTLAASITLIHNRILCLDDTDTKRPMASKTSDAVQESHTGVEDAGCFRPRTELVATPDADSGKENHSTGVASMRPDAVAVYGEGVSARKSSSWRA
eukprot:CAMPEP_0178997618 /NCGR_PEP_ID=MMETSP0795-20121207/9050_1 /TAXON_ID=88552 /ORGANISM="Amoebophrya sp., Strain Ameob2" /LENGTH=95 /DNA_ID=CAMNT_0020690191 /DNA_START=187 /DNA_END=474 /DNA_ORIENTATION=+